MDAANRVFKNPAVMWDWELARQATEELETPVYRGHLFVSEEAATRS
jgi:hypothetical protein